MLNERTALVTGASRGIGAAIALRLAKDGFRIIGVHRSRSASSDRLEGVLKEISSWNRLETVDTASASAVSDFFSKMSETGEQITDLVNCAGITRDGASVLMKDEAWQDVIETNLTGSFRFARGFALPAMRHGGGVITNISSVAGLFGNAGQSNYAASKGGLDALTKTLSKELGRSGIRVNSVAPGMIASDMTAHFDEKQLREMARRTSLRRIGCSEDVAGVVSFLHSADGAYVTGQVIAVDGGLQL